MNKRQLQKKQTKGKIIRKAIELYNKAGFLKTSTSQIANYAEIAHGTLFLHFPSKEILMEEIMDIMMDDISNQMYQMVQEHQSLSELLETFFDLLEKKESFFIILYKELPFYSIEIQRKILFKESIMRNHFINTIQSQASLDKSVPINTAVTMLFSTIRYYLTLHYFFTKDDNVIHHFRENIITTFYRLFQETKEVSE